MVSLHYELTDNRGILCFEDVYSIEHSHEGASLNWPGGRLRLGGHYGDPNAAIMDVAQGWCVIAGEGLEICRFDRGFPEPGKPVEDFPFRTQAFWRGANPPPDGQPCWFVEKLWFAESEQDAHGQPSRVLLHVLVEPGCESAGLYEVDIVSLAWRRI